MGDTLLFKIDIESDGLRCGGCKFLDGLKCELFSKVINDHGPTPMRLVECMAARADVCIDKMMEEAKARNTTMGELFRQHVDWKETHGGDKEEAQDGDNSQTD